MRATATFRLLPLFVTLWLVTNATVIAQTRVFGVVRDENSNPIQGASVTAENGDLTFIATTDADGNFPTRRPVGVAAGGDARGTRAKNIP